MGKKILCVDDDEKILDYLKDIFTDNGYHVYEAKDGVEAWNKVNEVKPDLITLDLDMPKEWGTRFYRKLKKSKDLSQIPIIVISGLSGTEYAVKDAVAVLDKPFDPVYLMKIVKEVLSD